MRYQPRRESDGAFLRRMAAESRRLADRAPEIAAELRGLAQQLESLADDLTRPPADES